MKSIRLLLNITFFLILICIISCSKNDTPDPLDSNKQIEAFTFYESDNSGIISNNAFGAILKDTIIINLPEGTNVKSLVPTIKYSGKSISPNTKQPQDFSASVQYTVTADDGSSKKYIVIVNLLSTSKDIILFTFKESENSLFISDDISGIVENDTVKVFFPSAVSLVQLIPTIEISGKTIFPKSNVALDFSKPVMYTVYAHDGSVKNYTVICYVNLAMYFAGNDGYVYALNATTGSEIWKQYIGSIVYSPTADKSKVYVVSQAGTIFALNNKTGEQIWSSSVGKSNSYPSLHNGNVYVAGNGFLKVLDTATGTLLKQFYYSGINPTITNNIIYFPRGLNGGVTAIDTHIGNSLWHYGSSNICVSNPALHDGTMFVGDELYTIAAINAITGETKWNVYIPAPGNNGGGRGAPSYSNGLVYIVNAENKLYSFNATTGSINWSKQLKTSVQISDPIANDNLVYITNNNILYAYNGISGEQRWQYSDLGTFGNCTFANNIVYMGSNTGYVYALDAISHDVKFKIKTNASGITTNICILDVSGKTFQSGDSGDQN